MKRETYHVSDFVKERTKKGKIKTKIKANRELATQEWRGCQRRGKTDGIMLNMSWPDFVVVLHQQQFGQVIYGKLDIRVQQQTWQTQHICDITSLLSFWPNLNLLWVQQISSPVCCASEVSTEVAVICRLALVSVTAENTMLHRDERKAPNTLSSNVEGQRKYSLESGVCVFSFWGHAQTALLRVTVF